MDKSSHLSLITAEAVGIGHPDKICDQIADQFLDKCLSHDKNSRVACEVFASNHLVVIGGEVNTKGYVDAIKCAWKVLLPLGYSENDFTILSNINAQSAEISQQVDKKNAHLGAGDIGVVYGYATNENNAYLPMPFLLATLFIKKINDMTHDGLLSGANYDSKCQVSVFYDDQGNPVGIDNVIVSLQHYKNASIPNLKKKIMNQILIPIAKSYGMNTDFVFDLNKNGSFIVGGPFGDTGLTGRKLMCDTYGSIGHHGGGAFSGKDYTKVDRTGGYLSRYIAKNLVAAKVADKLEIQLSFNIGSELPVSMCVNTFGTEHLELTKIYELINNIFPMRLIDVVNHFKMKDLIYSKYSVYGHFSPVNDAAPWEKLDRVKNIKDYINAHHWA